MSDSSSEALKNSPEVRPDFVLSANDPLTPQILRYWATLYMQHGGHVQKQLDALDYAIKVEEWQRAHGSKLPE